MCSTSEHIYFSGQQYDIFGGWITDFEQEEFLSVVEYLESDMACQLDQIEDHSISQIRIAATLRSESKDSEDNHRFEEANIQPHTEHFEYLPFL